MEIDQESIKGIQIKDILRITGTFDVATFNKKFEEDIIREKSVQMSSSSSGKSVMEEKEDDPLVESIPVNEESLNKLQESKRQIHEPMSSWFLKELILMSVKENNGKGKIKFTKILHVKATLQPPMSIC